MVQVVSGNVFLEEASVMEVVMCIFNAMFDWINVTSTIKNK